MKRFLCWDNKLIEENKGVEIIQHQPQRKNIALYCEDDWEGVHNGYAGIVKVNDVYRLYYRAQTKDLNLIKGGACACVAESKDGINFFKPNLGIYEFNNSKDNNIVFIRDKETGTLDSFTVFYDENPNCPSDEKFKALSSLYENEIDLLGYYASADGYHFRFVRVLPLTGTFDTHNVVLWDEKTEQYFIYYRNFHRPDGSEIKENEKFNEITDIRDVRVATSKDFISWTEHGRINFEEGQGDCGLYTNQIIKYYRDKDTFIGFPVRYTDRKNEKQNFKFMALGERHLSFTGKQEREGTALTDCLIMTSSNGFVFNRRDQAFLTPGVENDYNWWYGNCYTAYGLVETQAEDGEPNEISFYAGEGYRIKKVNFRRFSIRLDGFFSWYAKNCGGYVISKPIRVDGDNMYINFSSSAHGGIKISILDEKNNPIDGFESYFMFGNTTNRCVEFKKPLKDLKGKNVKLKIQLQDTHIYSIAIE